MIFGPDLLPKVLDRSKTMTRRRISPRTGHRYRVGREYAVQPGRGKKAVARIQIIAVREEWLTDLTEEDARAEGFADRVAFIAYWEHLYGIRSFMGRRVQVLTFWLVNYLCAAGCGSSVAEPGLCGECACEDDSDLYG